MRILGVTLLMAAGLALVIGLGGTAVAGGKTDNAKKIIGTWKIIKSDEPIPPGATVTFAKGGKLSLHIDIKGKEINLKGTYKVEGDKLTVTMKMGDEEKSETNTIQKLDATTLIIVDEKAKKVELKRQKKAEKSE
jgi:uncharacterized protein (TIGR03066 family)